MSDPRRGTTIEVFADLGCPFTHVGLRRLIARRSELGREDVHLRVRAWPLEIVNGEPLDPDFVAEEIDEIRPQVAPDLFAGFDPGSFPASSLPGLALEAAAYEHDATVGERVSLELRDRLFERGEDVADPDVLSRVASLHGIAYDPGDLSAPRRDHATGIERGVIGSPHFFTPGESFFCPALDVSRDEAGRLVVRPDPEGFDRFLGACFA